ncbi:hypothetical protein LCGC14_1612140 [marine sediment metagenome]|uniref:Uncharacterized protein n=1 Tax=marine sediment metagenome TaxID=412755 RepID=A0A0F9IUP4_9ZZZZ
MSIDLKISSSGTATGGSATTLEDTDLDGDYADDYYNGLILEIDGGTGIGETALITDYAGTTAAGMFGEFDWTKCKAQLPEWDGSTHHYHDSCDYPQCHGGKISGGDRSCNACGGKGWTPERMETTVEFEGFNFGGGLIQRLQTLAGVRGRIYQDPLFLGDQGAGVQLRFIFDGEGQGILMNTTGVITTEGVQS